MIGNLLILLLVVQTTKKGADQSMKLKKLHNFIPTTMEGEVIRNGRLFILDEKHMVAGKAKEWEETCLFESENGGNYVIVVVDLCSYESEIKCPSNQDIIRWGEENLTADQYDAVFETPAKDFRESKAGGTCPKLFTAAPYHGPQFSVVRDGIRYDTGRSAVIACDEFENTFLAQKDNGELYIADWNDPWDPIKIFPDITLEHAKKWGEEHMMPEAYIKVFGLEETAENNTESLPEMEKGEEKFVFSDLLEDIL